MLAAHFNLWFKEHLGDSPGNYLETGVFDGDGLRTLALAYPAKTFWGIDPFIEDGWTTHATSKQRGQFLTAQYEAAMRNCALPNVRLVQTTSFNFRHGLTPERIGDMDVRFVLIDGSHHYEDARSDLLMATELIQQEGIIGVDDLNVPDVKRAFDEWRDLWGQRVQDTGYEFCTILMFKR